MKNKRLPDDKFRGIKIRPDKKTYRLFIAIFPPDNYISTYRNFIRQFDKEKRNLRIIPLDQIHLTLKFIGAQVSEESKNIISETLSKYQGRFTKPLLKVEGVQFGFPHQEDPRVLMLKVSESKELTRLANEVHSVIRELRLLDTIRWKDKKMGEFHLSVARLKDSATRSTGKKITEIIKKVNIDSPEHFLAEYIDLVESQFTKGGIVYKRLSRIKI